MIKVLYNVYMIIFQNIGYTAPWMLIAYLIGSLNFAVIYSRLFRHEDIRDKGSGNAGATNVRRNYGSHIGYLTGVFDVIKLFFAMLIGFLVKIYFPTFSNIYLGLIGLAVIIGHMYPIYFGFRGGKGAACLLGFLIVMEWWLLPIGVIAFLLIIKRWKMVSLGTLIAPGIWIASATIFGLIFHYTNVVVIWNLPLANQEPWWVNIIYLLVAYGLIILKHTPNIKRLISHNENKIK